MRYSHQLRVRPSMPGVFRRTASQTRGKSLSASSESTSLTVPSRSNGRANAECSLGIETSVHCDAIP